MARLLEHQVKNILQGAGVAVPRSHLCDDPDAVAAAARELGGTVYVKGQVAAGDRARAGVVRRAEGPEAAREAAREILGSTFQGLTITQVLVEEAVEGSWHGYAAVTIEEAPPRRCVRFSRSGGAGFDPRDAEVTLDVDDEFELYRIRTALKESGTPSSELNIVSRFLHRLVEVARTWAAYTLEVNPLVFTGDGIVALDAKADLDDYSKSTIPEPGLLEVVESDERERAAREYQARDHRGSLRYVQLVPEGAKVDGLAVASHSVGGGESMVVLDALASVGLTPTNYCDTSGSPSADKVALGAKLVASQSHIDGLLFSTCIANQRLSVTAEGLTQGWRECGWRGPTVARIAGNEGEQARGIVTAWAREVGAPAVVLDETSSEWDAAHALLELLQRERTHELSGR